MVLALKSNMVRVEFGDNPRRALARMGITAPNLSGPVAMHRDTKFFGPVRINCEIVHKMPITIDAFTLINGGHFTFCDIGRYCSIAPDVSVGLGAHPMDRITSSPVTWDSHYQGWREFVEHAMKIDPVVNTVGSPGRGKTIIGHDVWLGRGVFIKAGVTIGHGAIIGAHACVLKDVPPYAIVGGVPAKLIRMRFPDAIIERLLALRWWRFALSAIEGLPYGSIEATLDFLEQRQDDLPEWNPPAITPKVLVANMARYGGIKPPA
jgi:acetyltransferase-like isoleucine patch superfamily enzyme